MSDWREEELLMMAEVVAQVQKDILPQGASNGSLAFSFPSIFISSFLLSFLTMSAFAGINIGAEDPEPVVTKEAKEIVLYVQVVKA